MDKILTCITIDNILHNNTKDGYFYSIIDAIEQRIAFARTYK